MDNIIPLDSRAWEAVDFPHFVGVRPRNGDWTHIFLKPTGQEIDIEATGKTVILHDNGIEWRD